MNDTNFLFLFLLTAQWLFKLLFAFSIGFQSFLYLLSSIKQILLTDTVVIIFDFGREEGRTIRFIAITSLFSAKKN